MTKRSIPFGIGLALMITTALTLSWAVAMASENFSVPMPFIQEFLRGSPTLIGTNYVFHLNITTYQFDYVLVTVNNTSSEMASGTVYVVLNDINGIIASGEFGTGQISGGGSNIPKIDLVWVSAKNITHFETGEVLITQSS